MDTKNLKTRYEEYMKHVKEINISDLAPPHFLEDFESPFNWIQLLQNGNLGSSDYLAKMDDYTNQRENYSFEKLIPVLALAFEYSLVKDFQQARFFLEKVENHLHIMEENNDRLYSRSGLAFQHIFLATKTNILFLEEKQSKEIENLKEKCRSLKPVSELDLTQQAGIHAVKAKFYLSCTTRSDLALSHMKKAIQLDPECATWKHWTGKVLRKIRRDLKEGDPAEEIKYFEEAVKQDRKAKHVVFLAQGYRELANYLRLNKNAFSGVERDDIYIEIDSLNERALELYKESVNLNPSSAGVCRRAGNGLMSLNKQFADYQLAKELLHKAEELSRNPVTFHILGTYYAKFEQDQDKAVEYFQKTADNNMVYGYHELIRIKYSQSPDYDALEDLLKAEKALQFSSNLVYIEGDLGWYHMVLKGNVSSGLEYFWRIIERDENLSYLKKFYTYSFFVKGPLNIYRVLQDKILSIDQENRDHLMVTFLEKVNAKPELLNVCEGSVSFEKAQREALTTLKWQRKKQKPHQVKPTYNNKKEIVIPNVKNQRNWRTETGVSNRNLVSSYEKKNQMNCIEKTPPKQENWRLECRKF